MSRINIKYISDETIETLRANLEANTNNLINNPTDFSWIHNLNSGKTFIEKKHTIEDFDFKMPKDVKDKETEIENSIILYEHLKELPMYVLSDERFWNWINFEKGYAVALKMIPVTKDSSVLKNHWLFSQGNRRSIFFGVFSRAYFRVALSVEESKADPYELTRFVIEKPNRFRNLSWRTYSSQKHIVLGALKAEKQIYDEYGDVEKNNYFTEIAKHISMLGSVMLLDAIPEKDVYDYVYKKYKQMIEKDSNIIR